jgi:hypothetical protein
MRKGQYISFRCCQGEECERVLGARRESKSWEGGQVEDSVHLGEEEWGYGTRPRD